MCVRRKDLVKVKIFSIDRLKSEKKPGAGYLYGCSNSYPDHKTHLRGECTQLLISACSKSWGNLFL